MTIIKTWVGPGSVSLMPVQQPVPNALINSRVYTDRNPAWGHIYSMRAHYKSIEWVYLRNPNSYLSLTPPCFISTRKEKVHSNQKLHSPLDCSHVEHLIKTGETKVKSHALRITYGDFE